MRIPPVVETRAVLSAGGVGHLLPELRSDADIRSVFEWLLSGDPSVDARRGRGRRPPRTARRGTRGRPCAGSSSTYPGDPGIAISLLLHTVVLRRGEALYLPAGNIHAYQEGLAIELMGASDNVLRGGLTPKHVDVAELLSMLDFRALPDPDARARGRDGVADFAPEGSGFRMRVVDAGTAAAIDGPAIVFPLAGAVEVGGSLVSSPSAVAITGSETVTPLSRAVVASVG